MMTNKPPYQPMTILSDATSMSEEERERLAKIERERWLEEDAEKWVEERLDEIFYLSIGNKGIARAVCEKAAQIAKSDEELRTSIKDLLKKKEGRSKKWSLGLKKLLLIHYAYEMLESNNNHQKAIEKVIEYASRISKIPLDVRSMENLITKAINELRKDNLALSDLPTWAQPIIQERINRGSKTRANKEKEGKSQTSSTHPVQKIIQLLTSSKPRS